MARVHARDAALKVASEGLRWAIGRRPDRPRPGAGLDFDAAPGPGGTGRGHGPDRPRPVPGVPRRVKERVDERPQRARRRDRGRGRDPARRPEPPPSATTCGRSRLQHPRGPAGALERRRLLRPRPHGAGQDLQQDRRLGARLRVRLEALPHPAAGGGHHGRGAAVGGHHRRRGSGGLRLPRAQARPRAHRRHPRHRHGRRAALPDDAARLLPGVRPARSRRGVPRPARRGPRRPS